MKITIVIPSYNQAGFIRETLDSILGQQTDHEVEVIVMDGGSTDGTTDILKEYGERIRWVSEKDEGQSDAVNKGIEKASGEIIGWLNSDDLYEPGSLPEVLDVFARDPDCRWVYGKCRIIDEEGKEIMKWITHYKNLSLKRYSAGKIFRENFISQPAVFFRKDLFEEAGPLDTTLNYAMDYDLWLRFAKRSKPCYIDRYLARFRRHGSSKSETGTREQFREEYVVCLRYGPSRYSKFMHWFNMYKIVLGYRFINLFFK